MKVKLNGNDFFEVTGNFGTIDYLHPLGHKGLDLAMNIGTKLFSPVDGTVKKVVDYGSENIGKGIYIETNDHQTVIMGHLSDIKAKVGQTLHEGEFVAYSGSTGRSTGGHLHLGLKDADGNFINPNKLVASTDSQETGIVEGTKELWSFLKEWKQEGSFFQAMYDKSFFEVIKDFTIQLINDIYVFVIENGDVFFILPAIVFMFVTFLIGRNKYTKFIIPLWFGYFISVVLNYIRCLPPQ